MIARIAALVVGGLLFFSSGGAREAGIIRKELRSRNFLIGFRASEGSEEAVGRMDAEYLVAARLQGLLFSPDEHLPVSDVVRDGEQKKCGHFAGPLSTCPEYAVIRL